MNLHQRFPSVSVFIFLFFIFLSAAIIWLSVVGIRGCELQRIAQSLQGREYRVELERIRIHPWLGIIADGVTLEPRGTSATSSAQPLLHLDRIILQPQLHQLVKGKLQFDSLQLMGATLRIPLPNSSEIFLEKAHASVFWQEKALVIPRGEFHLAGIPITFNATLLNPRAFQPAQRGTLARNPQSADQFQKFLSFLSQIQFPKSSPPSVHFRLEGDLADLKTIAVPTLELRAKSLRWQQVRLSNFFLDATFANQSFTLHQLHAEDDSQQSQPGGEGGELDAAGQFCLQSRTGKGFLRSSLDLSPLLRSFPELKALYEFQFQTSPLLELEIAYDESNPASAPLRILGMAQFENFTFRGVPVEQLTVPFAWRKNFLLARKASIRSQALTADFDLKFEDGELTLLAEGFLDPTRCKPWLDRGFRNTVSLMEFAEPGWAKVKLHIPMKAPSNLSGNGSVRLGKTATRGAWIDWASANFTVAEQATTFQNLTISAGNRSGAGELIYDFGKKQIRLGSIRSTLPPETVLLWSDPKILKAIEPYRFRSSPTVFANGTIGLASSAETSLTLTILSPEGLDYQLFGKDLHFTKVQSQIAVRGNSLVANVQNATLFNGQVQLTANVSLNPANPIFRVDLELERVDFASLAKLYFNYEDSTGKLSGNFSFTANFFAPENLDGSGHLRIEDGNIFAIPIFGPLSPLISTVLPGVGYQNSRLATASFRVGNQSISTEDLEIVGQGFSLYGAGKIYFVKNQLDLGVRLNVQGTPGILFLPISKFFEYYSDGTLQEPQWRPRNIPAELYGGGILSPLTRPVRNLLLPQKKSPAPTSLKRLDENHPAP